MHGGLFCSLWVLRGWGPHARWKEFPSKWLLAFWGILAALRAR